MPRRGDEGDEAVGGADGDGAVDVGEWEMGDAGVGVSFGRLGLGEADVGDPGTGERHPRSSAGVEPESADASELRQGVGGGDPSQAYPLVRANVLVELGGIEPPT